MNNVAAALAKAQMGMSKALKQSSNPHLGSKYADLGSVMDACLPSLNENGIAVIQPAGEDDRGRFVETILIHGESGDTLTCRVPLIIQKNDMQGFGSAVTYARRYGLMMMAGIAPEDDDGNAAAKAAPMEAVRKNNAVTPLPAPPEKYIKIADAMIAAIKTHGAANVQADKAFKVDFADLEINDPESAQRVKEAIRQNATPAPEKNATTTDNADLSGDNIPY